MRDGDIDMTRWNTCPENPNSGFPLSGLLNKIPLPLGGTASCPTCPVLIWKKKVKTLFPPFSNLVLDVFHRRRADLRGVCVCVCGCNSGLTLRLADTA